jgi:hypothetical protein
MYSFLFSFTLVLNSVLLFWKLFVYEFLPGISVTLLCSMSAPHVTFVPLLCASAANVVCRDAEVFGAKNVPFIIFCNTTVITIIVIIIIIIITYIYVCMNIILSRFIKS